jgi:IPT/TIG domain/Glucose / Sorbosone dehydrogenase
MCFSDLIFIAFVLSLGIAFDPTDTQSNPNVYFTASKLFHKGTLSSSGTSINGRIRRASGPNLETIIDIVTGLPVADLDHALNGLEFGDRGELYFCSGSNTNGGIPGQLSSSKLLKENFLSAAVNVAYLSHPDFDGSVRWSAPDNGNMIAKGIDLFAMGLRNPYSVVMHSNGKLYGTDNGPNPSYGRMSTGCGDGDNIDDAKANDEINHLQKGRYYGHPNKKRAAFLADPRQCVWYPGSAPSNSGYTAPLITGQSSIDGILEFHGNHFGGQLRYNLIFLRYNGLKNIFRVILTPDGSAVLPSITKPIPLDLGELGLDLTQAPNGNLIEMRYGGNAIFYNKPMEAATAAMLVKTVFPRRGVNGGGNTLYVYGVNFKTAGPAPTVQVGGKECPVTLISKTRIDCTLPGGAGTVDIVVNQGSERSIFERGYRYISGVHPPGFVLPIYSG